MADSGILICFPLHLPTVFKQALLLYQGTPCRIQFDQSPVTDSMEVRLVFSTNSSTPPARTCIMYEWMNEYIHTCIHTYIHTYVCHGLIWSAVIKVWGPADFGVISLITFYGIIFRWWSYNCNCSYQNLCWTLFYSIFIFWNSLNLMWPWWPQTLISWNGLGLCPFCWVCHPARLVPYPT
jgi:hypothetical protein